MDSKIGLIVQLAGVSLITLLTLFLRRSIDTFALKHWTNAWLFLSFALFCLCLAFRYEQYALQLFSLYFFTQYIFAFLLVAGCKSLVVNEDMRVRHELFVLPFILVAFGLPFISDDLSQVFSIHFLIMTGFLLAAVLALVQVRHRTFGWRVMMIALVLLTAHFVMFTVRQYVAIEFSYQDYDTVVGLVLQTLLGFGMVIVLLERVLTDFKDTNDRLRRAHGKLEEIAHVDPLTAALNRHAFYGYLKRSSADENQPVYGCVGFFDIDDLKRINDNYGHSVGDMVIRSVVRAIREIIRAEDLIFRWGGDEFFVIMIGMESTMGTNRMQRLEAMLSDIKIEGVHDRLTVGVSHAFADFADLTDLEPTIKKADEDMYRVKQIKKSLVADDRFDLGSIVMSGDALVSDQTH